jgi:hypothetical protein
MSLSRMWEVSIMFETRLELAILTELVVLGLEDIFM